MPQYQCHTTELMLMKSNENGTYIISKFTVKIQLRAFVKYTRCLYLRNIIESLLFYYIYYKVDNSISLIIQSTHIYSLTIIQIIYFKLYILLLR